MFDLTTTHGAHGCMVNDDLVRRVRAIGSARQRRIDSLRTKEEAVAYVREVRDKIRKGFGPFPGERSPLKAEMTRVTRHKGFSIECVLYESRPGFPVSAAVYRPDTPGRHPGIVMLSGHADEGKAWKTHMLFGQTLAKMGCVVIAPDPIGQGERWQFLGLPEEDRIEACCLQHNHLGKEMLLCGEFLGGWRVWDAIRSVDYLLTRPDVDPARIGATGASGGGTLAAYLFAMDDRVQAVAPGCSMTRWRRNVENELVTDAEQCPPGLLGQGLEMVDFLLARAPAPVRILAQRDDIFDIRGAREAYEDLRKVYGLLGREEAAEMTVTPHTHAFTLSQRTNLYAFFDNLFSLHGLPLQEDPFSPGDVRVSPGGQLTRWSGRRYRTVHDFLEEKLDGYLLKRSRLPAEGLRRYFKDKLHLPEPEEMAPVDYRVLEPVYFSYDKLVGRFRLEAKDGVDVILKIVDTDHAWQLPEMESARLYVPHLDSILEYASLPSTTGADCMLDVRGVGELEPSGGVQLERDFFHPCQVDYFYDATYRMLGTSYLEGKVRDIFKAVSLLRSLGCKALTLRGHGQGTIAVAIASLFLDCDVELTGAPTSWESMVRARVTRWPQSAMIADVLATTDLPDLYQALGGRLKLLTHWNHRME